MNEGVWSVWVDTGGTFTDCLAIPPGGSLRRAKVLSSSALRGRIEKRLESRHIEVTGAWDVPGEFFAGAKFRLLDSSGWTARVAGSSERGREIWLDRVLPQRELGGLRCEVLADVEAPILAAHIVTGTPLNAELPPIAMRLATTRGTNALLERRGADVTFFVTEGFADLLVISTQQRPDLFALEITRPEPMYREVVEVRERIATDGSVVVPLDLAALRSSAASSLERGVRSAAVALMNSYRNPEHEQRVTAALHEMGFDHVSASAELAPLIKLLPRAETAIVDAYLGPVIGQYLSGVQASVTRGTLHVMTSAGGLIRAADYRAKDALLSGPAGGVVGAARAGLEAGCRRVIAFDMGGTSTDVARWAGELDYVFEHRVGDARLVAPALAIESVAAGGGSVCGFRQGRLHVGPESAGADPGPACYGAGGPLAVTDVNLLLGRVLFDRFEIPLDRSAARSALQKVIDRMTHDGGDRPRDEEVLEGFLAIANERMAGAIRRISLRKGYDPRDHALVAFGGAGPQHACAVAGLLGVQEIVIPTDASLLSAEGLGAAALERFAHRQVLRTLAAVSAELQDLMRDLEHEAARAVVSEGVPPGAVIIRRRLLLLRLTGQETPLEVEWNEDCDAAASFVERYREVYGYDPPARPVEVESVRVVASTRPGRQAHAHKEEPGTVAPDNERRAIWLQGAWTEVPAVDRGALRPGSSLTGPALVVERHSVTVVEEGWSLEVARSGALVLGRMTAGGRRS